MPAALERQLTSQDTPAHSSAGQRAWAGPTFDINKIYIQVATGFLPWAVCPAPKAASSHPVSTLQPAVSLVTPGGS